MNIAVLSEICHTHSGSRAGIELAASLGKKYKHDTIYFVAFAQNSSQEALALLQENNVTVILLPVKSLSFFHKLIASTKLYSLFAKYKIDIVSFHGTLPMFLLARTLGKPIVTTYYGTQFDALLERFLPNQKISLFAKIVNILVNTIIYCSQAIPMITSNSIISISKTTAKECKKLYRKNTQLIYLGVNSKNFSYDIYDPLVKTKNIIHLLSVSRLTPYKGHHLLMEAVEKIQKQIKKTVKLTIVGEIVQPAYASYLNKIRSSNTEILHNVSDSTLSGLYKQTNIYVSFDRYLFLGLPVIEAALFKKPAIVFSYQAASEIVQQAKTGYIVKTIDDFCTKLTYLSTHPAKILAMGQQAYTFAKKQFIWENTTDLYYDVFQNIFKSKT